MRPSTRGAPWPLSPSAGSPARAATSPPRKVATETRWSENRRKGFPSIIEGVFLFERLMIESLIEIFLKP